MMIRKTIGFKQAAQNFMNKTIPLFCLSPNLIGLTSRYYRNFPGIVRYENYSGTTKKIIKTTTNLAKSYAKIKKYSESLICAFDDALIEHCIEIYKLFLEIK